MSKKLIAVLLLICMLFICCACGGAGGNNANNAANTNNSSNTVPANDTTPKGPDAETAMANFVKKLQAGNYVVDVPSRTKLVAASPEIVYIDFKHELQSEIVAFMTIKNETFQVYFYGDEVGEPDFMSMGSALDSLGYVLPNYWIKACGGNMWDLFYNDPQDPLHFTSKDNTVKTSLLAIGGYKDEVIEYMEDVNMYFDAEDPTSVHFTATVNDAGPMIKFDDLDLTLQFGAGASDPRIDAWMSSPVYPPTRRSWTQEDIYMFDNIFMRGYGRQAMPFPKFASYTMVMDQSAYDAYGMIRLTDGHGTEKDVEDYKAKLLAEGFVKGEGIMSGGQPVEVYRKLLREEFNSYAQLYPYYDSEKGFVLEARRYNENPSYTTLAEINEVIQKFGFPAIPETDAFDEITFATDVAKERSEDYAYWFDYKLYLPVVVSYSDINKVRTFLEVYGAGLAQYGLLPIREPGEYGCRYDSVNGADSFWFEFTELEQKGSVSFIFKHEDNLTAEEAIAALKAHGLPETEVFGQISCKDITRYRYELSGFTGLFMQLSQQYDSMQKVDEYLNKYVSGLIDQGYLPTDPKAFDSYKNYLYFNQDLRKFVAFSVIENARGASIDYEFMSSEDDSNILLNAIGR